MSRSLDQTTLGIFDACRCLFFLSWLQIDPVQNRSRRSCFHTTCCSRRGPIKETHNAAFSSVSMVSMVSVHHRSVRQQRLWATVDPPHHWCPLLSSSLTFPLKKEGECGFTLLKLAVESHELAGDPLQYSAQHIAM